jgi:hypothetical protein
MTTSFGLPEIGILAYPASQLAAILGLTDIFGEAGRISHELGVRRSRIIDAVQQLWPVIAHAVHSPADGPRHSARSGGGRPHMAMAVSWKD